MTRRIRIAATAAANLFSYATAADKAATVLNVGTDPDVCAARERAWGRGA